MATGCKKQPEPDNRLSTESKESSYMGFDRGIDSDIEIESPPGPSGRPVTPARPGGLGISDGVGSATLDPMGTNSRCSSEPHLKKRMVLTPKLARWESLDPPESNDSKTLLAPNEPTVAVLRTDSPRKSNPTGKDQGIYILNGDQMKNNVNHKSVENPTLQIQDMRGHTVTVEPLNSVGSFTSIGYHSGGVNKNSGCFYTAQGSVHGSLLILLSGMYAMLLVVMGLCFPVAEVLSEQIPVSYYEGFYLFLYMGSLLFLLFVYIFILKRNTSSEKRNSKMHSWSSCFKILIPKKNPSPRLNDHNSTVSDSTKSLDQQIQKKKTDQATCYGSFYLRLGAVGFGIGSMIYSGLEFGQFFELETGTHCYNVLYGITPTARMAFTFVQMYFIFLNSRISINKYKAVARFGLMHMIATNLCIWLHVLVQETKHSILTLINFNLTHPLSKHISFSIINAVLHEEQSFGKINISEVRNQTRMARSIQEKMMYAGHECRRSNIMGELVQEASHFLFPCTIQYSLICSAVLYIMWKNIGLMKCSKSSDDMSCRSSPSARRHQHYPSDCAKANKGLFMGILILVLSIISIILFFVLIGKPEYKLLAIIEARITELVLYMISSLSVTVALLQIRELKHNPLHNAELSNILLIVGQKGLYFFTMFSIIGAHFTPDSDTLLVLITYLACIIQATLQTIFILDASCRYVQNTAVGHKKPGRELVTFLLVCNFAMWVINTLQAQRADSNPIQLEFYGLMSWTVIAHVTAPLAIYFRFHSTVCLCDIWKRTYEMKPEYV